MPNWLFRALTLPLAAVGWLGGWLLVHCCEALDRLDDWFGKR